ncbi:MAG: serine/threonine protein kinase [Pseudomonadales bacterium]|nr:serine/threonine protein kinase [Pseudomonadales bacterium]
MTDQILTPESGHPFEQLTPDAVLDAVESLGFLTDARIITLNSYENRVFQVGLEDSDPVIVKFYRPNRWSDAQILEEHQFTQELAELEIPAVPPMAIAGQTLFTSGPFSMAVYPRRTGRAPDLGDLDNLIQLGRYIARIHACGSIKTFEHRLSLDMTAEIESARTAILRSDFLPPELRLPYEKSTGQILDKVASIASEWQFPALRLHGDCHVGNILVREDIPFFVDFDDSFNGPAIQDLWLFLSGEKDEQRRQFSELVEGYEEFSEFDTRQTVLIESLRSFRIIRYAAWLAKRWDDPAFPKHFPWFAGGRFWSDHILELREQEAALDEQPISLY